MRTDCGLFLVSAIFMTMGVGRHHEDEFKDIRVVLFGCEGCKMVGGAL